MFELIKSEDSGLAEFRDFVYIRLDPPAPDGDTNDRRRVETARRAAIRAHLKMAEREDFNVARQDVTTEEVSPAVAVSGRPKFLNLLGQLKPETGLVVQTPDALGRDAADLVKTLRLIQSRGAEVYCLSICHESLIPDDQRMKMLEAVAELDRLTESARKKAKGCGLDVAGGRIGRPPALDEKARADVRASLRRGETVSVLARAHKTSRQTIMRIRDQDRD